MLDITGMLRLLVLGACLQVLQGAVVTEGLRKGLQEHLPGCKAYTRLLGWVDEAHEDLYTLQAATDRHDITEVKDNFHRVIYRARQWITKFQGPLLRMSETCNLIEWLEHIQEEFYPSHASLVPSPNDHLRAMKRTFLKPDHKKRVTLLAQELVRMVSRHSRRRVPAGEDKRQLERQVQNLLLNTLWAAHASRTPKINWRKVGVVKTGVAKTGVVKTGVADVDEAQVVREVPDTFLSVALGPRLIQHQWFNFNTSSPLVLTLTRALAPAILRMGGSAANFLTYEPRVWQLPSSPDGLLRPDTGAPVPSRHVLEDDQSGDPSLKNDRNGSDSRNSHADNTTEDERDITYSSNTIWTKYQHSRSQSDWSPVSRSEGDAHSDVRDGRHPDGGLDDRSCNTDHDSSTFTNFTMTRESWSQLLGLAEAAGMTLLFDVNQFYRAEDGSWDPSNVRLLMRDAAARGARLIWQLGNEPNAYGHKFGWSVTGQEAAQDYLQLRQELDQYFPGPHHTLVVGPDVTRPKPRGQQEPDELYNGVGKESIAFLREFLSSLKFNLSALSWHQYYLDGRTAQVDDFLSPAVMDQFKWQIDQVVGVRDHLSPGTPIWLTETGSAYGGGARGLSDAYVGGFLWLDKLGVAATMAGGDGDHGGQDHGGHEGGGIQLVARQTLYEGCYALISMDLVPNPDYWLSVLYKRLVGGRVLRLRLRQVPPTTRLYAHCLRNITADHTPGAVVVFGMNLLKEATQVRLEGHLATSPLLQYLLLPPDGDLQSRQVMLNGQLLQMTPEGDLPDLTPTPLPPALLHLPPTSLGFWVMPHAHARACM
nr:heparanase-like [Procambarus clarkii]